MHTGTLQSGHYYTYLRTSMTTGQMPTKHNIAYYDETASLKGNWYCANDNNITPISETNDGIPVQVSRSSGYLLFYEQLPIKYSNSNDSK